MHNNEEIREEFYKTLRAEVLKISNLPVISEGTTKQRADKNKQESTLIYIDNAHPRKLCFSTI